jgi:hypothetical protein
MKVDEMGEAYSTHAIDKYLHNFSRTLEGKRPLLPTRWWEDDIKMYLKGIGCQSVYRIHQA